MACTYNPDLESNLDWVRFLISDVNVPDDCTLQDEEIQGIIKEVLALHGPTDGTKYCAAAIAWDAMLAKLAVGGGESAVGPVVEKAVGRLRLRFAEGVSTSTIANRFGDYLKGRCAWYMTPRPRGFKSVGKIRCRGRRVVKSSGEVGK